MGKVREATRTGDHQSLLLNFSIMGMSTTSNTQSAGTSARLRKQTVEQAAGGSPAAVGGRQGGRREEEDDFIEFHLERIQPIAAARVHKGTNCTLAKAYSRRVMFGRELLGYLPQEATGILGMVRTSPVQVLAISEERTSILVGLMRKRR